MPICSGKKWALWSGSKKMEKIPVWVLQPKDYNWREQVKKPPPVISHKVPHWLKHGNFLKDRIHFLHPWRFPVLGVMRNSLGVLWKVLLFSWKGHFARCSLYTRSCFSREVQRKGYDSQGHTGRLAPRQPLVSTVLYCPSSMEMTTVAHPMSFTLGQCL